MPESALYYVVGYIGNLIIYLMAAYTEMTHLRKREDFSLRLTLCAIVMVTVTAMEIAVTQLLQDGSAKGYFFSIAAHTAVIFVFLLVYVCYAASVSKSLFIVCGAIIVKTLLSCEMSIILLLLKPVIDLTGDVTSFQSMVAGFTYSIVMLVIWMVHPIRKKVSTNVDEFRVTSPVILGTLIPLCCVLPVFLSQIYFVQENHPGLHLLVLAAVATLCIVGLAIQHIITVQFRNDMDRELTDQLIRESEKRFRDVKENIEIINIKCHDLRHRLRDYEEIHGALSPEMRELTRAINIYDSDLHTGNEALDIVLSDHMLRAANRDVQISCVADGHLLSFMAVADIYSMFNNLFGNALEYVETLDVENRFIRFTIVGISGFVKIQMENYFDGSVEIEDGIPVTTKGSGRDHGFGMKSIRRIVSKYGGTMGVSTENNLFTVNIVLQGK